MGHQYGDTIFWGTAAGITGYADMGMDGEVHGYARNRSTLDGRRWKRDACFAGSRKAAEHFGIASRAAGMLWQALPHGLRRLGDTGAFNRLVGHCRMLVEEGDQFRDQSAACRVGSMRDGEIWEWEGLKGLDFNEDGMGPLSMKSGKLEVKRGKSGRLMRLRLSGMEELAGMLDGSCGNPDSSGRRGRHVVANRIVDFSKVFERPSDAVLGDCRAWGGKSGKLKVKSGESGNGRGPVAAAAVVPLRARVWVHAVEVPVMQWSEVDGRWEFEGRQRLRSWGYESEWMCAGGELLMGIPEGMMASGVDGDCDLAVMGRGGIGNIPPGRKWVVFVGVEVSAKRGRHWVRLPFCCQFRVWDVVGGMDAAPAPVKVKERHWGRGAVRGNWVVYGRAWKIEVERCRGRASP